MTASLRDQLSQRGVTAAANPIDIVCIDVDGTLVGSGGLVHASVWPAVSTARDAGLRLVLCSGRPAFGLARSYAERLDGAGWHSFQNGGCVINLAHGTSRSSYLSTDTVRDLITRARSTNRVLELYADTSYAVESRSRRARAHAQLLGVPFATRPFESLDGAVVRAQWLLPHDEAEAMLKSAPNDLEVALSTSPIMPDTTFVGVTRAGVTKATAVRAIASEYAVPLQRVMFVGDGGNDVSALQLVGLPVAMGNAEPSALASARMVVADVDRGGLAEALTLAITLHRS